MSSSRPYLLPALLEWIVDNDCTPHVVIRTDHPDVRVPEGYCTDHQIILNISPSAVGEFELTRKYIFFKARFAGVPREIYAPLDAVVGIFSRETGEGMSFSPDPEQLDRPDTGPKPVSVPTAGTIQPKKSRPNLRLVQDDDDDGE